MGSSVKMKNEDLWRIAGGFLAANIMIGRSQGVLAAVVTPFLIPVVCLMLNSGLSKVSFRLFVISGYALLLSNDLLLRFFYQGDPGWEVDCFFFLSLLAAYVLVSGGFVVLSLAQPKHSRFVDWATIAICMSLVFAEFALFQSTVRF